jgi:hypothetical protein
MGSGRREKRERHSLFPRQEMGAKTPGFAGHIYFFFFST